MAEPDSGGRVKTLACVACARNKCRCIYNVNNTVCERCIRLKKNCIGRRAASQRQKAKRTKHVPQSTRFEETLDDIVSLLKSRAADENSKLNRRRNQVITDLGAPQNLDIALELPTSSESRRTEREVSFAIGWSLTDTRLASRPMRLDVPDEESRAALNRFRDEMLDYLPFIWIPPDVDHFLLKREYPFLWLAITSVASQSPRVRMQCSQLVREMIINRIVLQRHSSFDLLLGLMTYQAWAHLHQGNKPHISLFSQLVSTLVHDLALHKPPEDRRPAEGSAQILDSILSGSATRRHQEHRAILGAYFISSWSSVVLGHTGNIQWSAYLDVCLDQLVHQSNLPQDDTLVSLVKIQLVVDQVNQAKLLKYNNGVPDVYVSALKSRLRELRSRNTGLGRSAVSHVVLSQSYFAELFVQDSVASYSSLSNYPGFHRFESYYSQFASIQMWLDNFLTMPPNVYESLTGITYSQLFRVLDAFHRLATLEDPAWDRVAVCSKIDISSTLNKLVNIFVDLEAANTAESGIVDGDTLWPVLVGWIQRRKTEWEAMFRAIDDQLETMNSPTADVHGVLDWALVSPASEVDNFLFSTMLGGS